jgi:parvulin-like peptidyl-prolyl isomerase
MRVFTVIRIPRKLVSLPLLLVLLVLLAPAGLSAEVLNRVVLRVNDHIATLYDYQQRRAELVREIQRREQDPEERQRLVAEAGETVFSDLYQELLLRSRADQLAVTVADAQVDAYIAQIRQNFGIKTDQEFAAALASSGLTEATLREQARSNMRLQTVRDQEIRSRINIEEDDLRRYYRKNIEQFRQPEQLQLREVVVLDEGGLPTAEERAAVAAEIRQAVASGKSLADAVVEYAGRGVTSNAIELGWVAPGDLDPSLEAAAWKLQAGTLSEPVAARGGLHLVQVVDRRESRVPPFSEVAEAIRAREQERVYLEEALKYMAELEKRSLVVATPPQEAANFRRRIQAAPAMDDGLEELTDTPADTAATPAPTPDGAAVPGSPATGPSPTQRPGTLPEPKPVDPTAPVPPPG